MCQGTKFLQASVNACCSDHAIRSGQPQVGFAKLSTREAKSWNMTSPNPKGLKRRKTSINQPTSIFQRFGVNCFWAPIVLPLSSKSIYFFPGGTQQLTVGPHHRVSYLVPSGLVGTSLAGFGSSYMKGPGPLEPTLV